MLCAFQKTDHSVLDHNVKKLLVPEVLETVFSDQKEGKCEFQKFGMCILDHTEIMCGSGHSWPFFDPRPIAYN